MIYLKEKQKHENTKRKRKPAELVLILSMNFLFLHFWSRHCQFLCLFYLFYMSSLCFKFLVFKFFNSELSKRLPVNFSNPFMSVSTIQPNFFLVICSKAGFYDRKGTFQTPITPFLDFYDKQGDSDHNLTPGDSGLKWTSKNSSVVIVFLWLFQFFSIQQLLE